MDAKTFIHKTQELVPNEEIVRQKINDDFYCQLILNNYLSFKDYDNIIDTEDPIDFILDNCDYSNFRTNPIDRFIDTVEISHFRIFGDTDLGYIGIDDNTKIIFKISYEPIAEYLYGDGAIPEFDDIMPIAKNIYCFFDALVYWLELNKIVNESNANQKMSFRHNETADLFMEKAIEASGGSEYKFGSVF
ncbi:hypothetical protein [Emticicia agri]|uniref:Uncharacterized protein n=1 Tax=Emticicia agri TaxID=2492393 RepID=A0A4Q5M1X8_9BACT|nr:hypothetical protein [Emticicia agri]RYU96065.1 hypothetical protein EWM59_09215 [Emticicia agri]